MGFSVVD